MEFSTLDALQASLSPRKRLLGLDLGTKTIGLALSDVERRIATPLETIRRTKFQADAKQLLLIIAQFEIGAMVLGLPLNMDGSEGPRVQATKAFARSLANLTETPIVLWDERLSTAAVTRSLIEQGASRAKRAEIVDRMAAAYILQGAIDRMNTIARQG
jgi:putative Holliday junction resolvase